MNGAAILIFVLTLGTITLEFVCTHWIKKWTNSYFLWAGLGAFWFIWLVCLRFAPQWIEYANYQFVDPTTATESYVISKAFLLDVCPFFCLTLLLSLVFDPSRRVARALAPIALIGGLVTVFPLCFGFGGNPILSAEYIFMGEPLSEGGHDCYFIMHFLQVILSIGVLLNTPRCGWKGTVATFIIWILYYSYVLIVMRCTGCSWNVSGLSLNDWTPYGEYHGVAEVSGLPPQVCQAVMLPTFGLIGCGIIALKDYVLYRGWFSYGNAYSNKWYHWYNINKFVKQRVW